jgi:hypothetical protein
LRIEPLEDRCLLAARPWEFLSATSQIQQNPDQGGVNVFRAIQHADFNKDGRLDFVVTQARSTAGVDGTPYRGVLYMNEDGQFVDRTAQYFPALLNPAVRWWSALHDYFNSGWIDVYIGGANGAPSKFFKNLGNDANGQWQGFADQSFRIRGPSAIAVDSYHQHKADLNGDGRMDIVEYQNHPDNNLGQIRVLINRGRSFVDETAQRMPQRQEPSIFGHVEDLSGDGLPDISIANLFPTGGVPELRVLINDGTGHFPTSLEQVVPQPINSGGVYGLDHVDVNGDGRLDIYVLNFGVPGDGFRDAILMNLGSGNQLFTTVYYPEFPNGLKDGDGDHPIAADFDGDGRMDIAVAQFGTGTFVLHNETVGGVTRLVEKTPPQIPSAAAFRLRAFDANNDGVQDLVIGHDPPNFGISLTIGNVAEQEPNGGTGNATPITTFPALITGALNLAGDRDIFALSGRAINEGTRIRLRPAANSDLRLQVLDAAGNVLATSQNVGNGVLEQLDIAAGSAARFLRVDLQGALGSGLYRLEIDVLP